MTNLILLISGDAGADRPWRQLLTQKAPACRLELAANSAEIETLPTPSLILLDFAPSPEPAFDILRWLRAERRFKQVPVFVLAPQTVDVNEAYALGANSCFIRTQAHTELEPIMDGIAAYASLIGDRAS
jgi:DNA-binding response OmpR family regulator